MGNSNRLALLAKSYLIKISPVLFLLTLTVALYKQVLRYDLHQTHTYAQTNRNDCMK